MSNSSKVINPLQRVRLRMKTGYREHKKFSNIVSLESYCQRNDILPCDRYIIVEFPNGQYMEWSHFQRLKDFMNYPETSKKYLEREKVLKHFAGIEKYSKLENNGYIKFMDDNNIR